MSICIYLKYQFKSLLVEHVCVFYGLLQARPFQQQHNPPTAIWKTIKQYYLPQIYNYLIIFKSLLPFDWSDIPSDKVPFRDSLVLCHFYSRSCYLCTSPSAIEHVGGTSENVPYLHIAFKIEMILFPYINQHRSNVSDTIETSHISTKFVKVFVHSTQIDCRCISLANFFGYFLVDIWNLASANNVRTVFNQTYNRIAYFKCLFRLTSKCIAYHKGNSTVRPTSRSGSIADGSRVPKK